jgi:hypothetical protein
MRWIQLITTSPSGKTLFVCRSCGRVTPGPSACKDKPEIPAWHKYHGLTCEEIEEREKDQILHPILKNAVVRSKVLAEALLSGSARTAAGKIKTDRQAVCDLVIHAVNKAKDTTAQDWWRVWSAVDEVREELKKK